MNENSGQSEPPPPSLSGSFSSSDPNQYEPDHNRNVQQPNHPVDDCQTGEGFSAMLMESSGSSPRPPRYTNLTANNSESLQQHHQSTSHIMVPLVHPNYNSNHTYGDDQKQIPGAHSKVKSPVHYINYPVHGMIPIQHHPPMHPMVLHRENQDYGATNSEHIVWFQGSSSVALENGPLDLRGQSISPAAAAENVNNFHNWNYPTTSVITTGKRVMHPEYMDMTSHLQQHHPPPLFPEEFQGNDATVIEQPAATIKLTSKRASSTGFSRSSVSSSYRGDYSSRGSKGRVSGYSGGLLSSRGSKTRLNLDCEEQFKVDNEALVTMPVRQLNKLIKDLTKEEQDKYKKLRRQLKNRKYASNCRSKRCNMKKNLDAENERLEMELRGLQDTLNARTKEERYLKEMLEGLNFRSRVGCDENEIEEHAQIRERSEFGERSIIITNTINNNNNNNSNNHNNDFMSMA